MNNPKEADIKETLVSFADQISTLMTKYHHKELDFDAVNTHSIRYQEEALAAILEQFEKDVLNEVLGGEDYPEYYHDPVMQAKAEYNNELLTGQRQRLTALLEKYRKGGSV